MRTNIDIDDELLAQAMKESGTTTKKQAVEAALKFFVDVKARAGIRRLHGKVEFYDDVIEERRLASIPESR